MKLRKLTSALVAAGALSSPWALGLGLGDIQLKSALNQPLQAEIKLLQTRELAQEEILPSLADEAEFERAGVERFFFLSDIDFDVTLSGKGDGSLLLTTKQSVQEPFLNFLVEVNWPNGRVLREYTILLDPPVYEDEVAQPVVTPKTTAPTKTLMDAEKASVAKKNARASVTPVQTSSTSGDSRIQNGTFGPVQSSDTLWDIALKVRPDRSVTVQQTMMSIRELNPNAFVAGNINKIKKGAVLRVPTLEQIQNWKLGSAVEEVAAHNKRYKDSISPDQSGQVQLSGVDQALQAPVVAPEEARLKIVRSEEKALAAGAASGDQMGENGGVETLQNELAITQENLDKANRENEKLAARLEALESQMSKLSRLVTLKDTQMAELQMTAGADEESLTNSVNAESVSMEQAEAVVEEVASSELESDSSEAMPADDMTTQESDLNNEAMKESLSPASESSETVDQMASDEAQMSDEVVEEAVQPSSPPIDKPVLNLNDVKQPSSQKMPESLTEKILGNPIWLVGIGAGSLLFVILLFMLSRRSYQRESELTEVIDQARTGSDLSDNQSAAENIDDIDQELDNLDLEPQGFGQVSLDGDDAIEADDVVARADSFIAYGQFDNAIGLLEESINNESSRIDLRLKMLEVYAEMQDSQGFERQKQEILDLGADDVISQINVLEQKLPGYTGEASVSAFDSGESLNVDVASLDDADFDLSDSSESDDFSYSLEDLESELASDLSGETIEESSVVGSDLDDIEFNLDEELGISDKTEEAVVQQKDDYSLDVDFDVEDTSAPVSDETLDSLDELAMPDFEAELDVVQDSSDVLEDADLATESIEEDSSMDSGLDLDLEGDDLSTEDLPAVEDNVLGSSETSDLDDFSLDLDSVESVDELSEGQDSPVETVADEETPPLDSDMDIGADLEDLAKSLGVDSADDVDLDAELATASGMVSDVEGETVDVDSVSEDLVAEDQASEQNEFETPSLESIDVADDEGLSLDAELSEEESVEMEVDSVELSLWKREVRKLNLLKRLQKMSCQWTLLL